MGVRCGSGSVRVCEVRYRYCARVGYGRGKSGRMLVWEGRVTGVYTGDH